MIISYVKRTLIALSLFALSAAYAHETGIHQTGKVTQRPPYSLLWLPDGRLLLGHAHGVLVTRDYGRRWNVLARQSNLGVVTLQFAGKRIIASGKQLYATSTKGERWSPGRLNNLKGTNLRAYAVNAWKTNEHYAWEAQSGLHASRDNGRSWRSLRALTLPRGVQSLAVNQQGDIYAAHGDDGVWVSRDAGNSFARLRAPDRQLGALAVAKDGNLWAGGKSGLWRRNQALWVFMADEQVTAFAVDPRSPSEAVWIDEAGRVHRNENLFAQPGQQQP